MTNSSLSLYPKSSCAYDNEPVFTSKVNLIPFFAIFSLFSPFPATCHESLISNWGQRHFQTDARDVSCPRHLHFGEVCVEGGHQQCLFRGPEFLLRAPTDALLELGPHERPSSYPNSVGNLKQRFLSQFSTPANSKRQCSHFFAGQNADWIRHSIKAFPVTHHHYDLRMRYGWLYKL